MRRPTGRGQALFGLPIQLIAREGARPAPRVEGRGQSGQRSVIAESRIAHVAAETQVGRTPRPIQAGRGATVSRPGIASVTLADPTPDVSTTVRGKLGGKTKVTSTTIRSGFGVAVGEGVASITGERPADARTADIVGRGGGKAKATTAKQVTQPVIGRIGGFADLLTQSDLFRQGVIRGKGGGKVSQLPAFLTRTAQIRGRSGGRASMTFVSMHDLNLTPADVQFIFSNYTIHGIPLGILLRKLFAVVYGPSSGVDRPGVAQFGFPSQPGVEVSGETDGRGNRRNVNLHIGE